MAVDPLHPRPPNFASLARRITGWTTNGVLTVVVLVAGLSFGRQVLTWWAADDLSPGDAAITPANPLSDPTQTQSLRFGDSAWTLSRRSVTGEMSNATKLLREECSKLLQTGRFCSSFPARLLEKEGAGNRTPPAANPEEAEALWKILAKSKPIAQQLGRWRLYELHETFPLMVGLVRGGTLPEPAASDNTRVNLAQLGYRMVIWGIAVPMGQQEWSLCMFYSKTAPAEGGTKVMDVPLPPEGHQILSLSAADGSGIVSIQGFQGILEWKQFYNEWFSRRGWTSSGWRAVHDIWSTKFSDSEGNSIDIRFGPDGRGGLSGLLMTAPPERRRTAGEKP